MSIVTIKPIHQFLRPYKGRSEGIMAVASTIFRVVRCLFWTSTKQCTMACSLAIVKRVMKVGGVCCVLFVSKTTSVWAVMVVVLVVNTVGMVLVCC